MRYLQQQVMVSIIIPIYNSERVLHRCLDSVKRQTYKNYEAILIDDGSIDLSSKICHEYIKIDNRFKYIYQVNNGVGSARNRGIEYSEGEYITFVDSDDSIEPGFIELILGRMMAEKADLGICDINYINSITLERKVSKIRFAENMAFYKKDKSKFNKLRTFAWGKIYKKELFDKIRFPNLEYFEDLATTPVIYSIAEKIIYVPSVFINYYRVNADALSEKNDNIDQLIDALKLLSKRLKVLGLYEIFLDEYKKMCIGQLRFLYRRFYNMKDVKSYKKLEKIKHFIVDVFPELNELIVGKFFVFNNNLLSDAVDKAVLTKDQIINNISEANYCICFDNEQLFNVSIPIIEVKSPYNIDREMAEYDIADEIIDYFIKVQPS